MIRRVWHELWVALVDSLLVHTLRSSMLTGGVVVLVSSTGMWQYMASSFDAYDAQRAVAHQRTSTPPKVVVVTIDDAGYSGFFHGRSPLDRARLTHLLETIAHAAPNAQRVILDLDVQPNLPVDPAQDGLDRMLRKSPEKWVLPHVPSMDLRLVQNNGQWLRGLCDAGVRFGHSLVPTEFGYPKLTLQYAGGLTDVALHQSGDCSMGSKPVPQAVSRPLSPAFLSAGMVIPFDGNLVLLEQLLSMLEPEWVFVGAAWGSMDLFATPFGDRYGVQIHAAGLAGVLESQRMVPFWVQLLMAWVFVAVVTAFATVWVPRLQNLMHPRHEFMSGHLFFQRVLLPVLFVVFTVAGLFALAECLAVIRAHTSLWVPTAPICSTVGIYMMVVWVWGRHAARPHEGAHQAWSTIFWAPVQADVRAMRRCLVLLAGQSGKRMRARLSMGKFRVWIELLLAVASALMQTVVPAIAVVLAFQRPV